MLVVMRFSILLVATLVLPVSLYAQTSPVWDEPNESDLRILQVQLERYVLDDVLPAYQNKDGLLVPLGELSALLGLAIKTNPANQTAEGFILEEDRRIYLDVSDNEITINGENQYFDKEAIKIYQDDIYVDTNLLSKWLPLTLQIDLFSSKLLVKTEEPFPLQKRLERERRIAKTRSYLSPEKRNYPHQKLEYRAWNNPFIDQTIRMSMSENDHGSWDTSSQYVTYMTSDLLFMESSLYLIGDNKQALSDWRFTMGRKDPNAELLGPLHAREYSFGHIYNPNIDLISVNKQSNPGVSVSNYPLTFQNQYDRHSFRGDLLPGWEVELYHNNALLDYQQSDNDGQYNFDDVPLLFGNNYFRLVFYGPQGQTKEETYTFVLNQSMTRPGDQYYRISQYRDEFDFVHSYLQYDVGLSKKVSAHVSLVNLPVNNIDKSYQKIGLRGFLDNLFLRADIVSDDEEGKANVIGVQARVGVLNVTLENTNLDNFVSEVFSSSQDPIKNRQNMRFDASLSTHAFPRIPITLELKKDTLLSGIENRSINNRVSVQQSGSSTSNELIWNYSHDRDPLLNGNLQHRRRMTGYTLRTQFLYQLRPEKKNEAVVLGYEGSAQAKYRPSASLTRNIINDFYELQLGMTRKVDDYSLSLIGRYLSDGDLSINLTASSNIGHEPRENNWFLDSRPMAGNGNVSARVFLDSNQDGIYNIGETLIPHVGFKVNGSNRTFMTNEHGITLINNLPTYQEVDIALNIATLEDPLWQPYIVGKQIVPRPGHVAFIDFPVHMTGEIDGVTYIVKHGREREVGEVELELIDEEGEIIQTVRSAYDGFYLFSKIPMGKYRLRVSPEQIKRLNLASVKEQEIIISDSQLFASYQNFILKPIR